MRTVLTNKGEGKGLEEAWETSREMAVSGCWAFEVYFMVPVGFISGKKKHFPVSLRGVGGIDIEV